MAKRRRPEEVPLMGNQFKPTRNTFWEPELTEKQIKECSDSEWIHFITSRKRMANGRSLLVTDAVLLIVHYLQLYAVLQSLSLHWPWPDSYLVYAKYLFLFNLDVWEFLKIYKNGIPYYYTNYFVPSATVPVDYTYLMAGWLVFFFLLILIYTCIYFIYRKTLGPLVTFKVTSLKRVLFTMLQVLIIPIGTFFLRFFHCNSEDKVDVKNELTCFSGLHWAYILSSLVICFVLFVVYPAWLISRTKRELLNAKDENHELHLQLKEIEFAFGIDINWAVGSYYIFASFKKLAVHFYAAHTVIFAVILILYAALLSYPFTQVCLLNGFFVIMLVTFAIIRPFRVTSYNVMLIINYICLVLICLTGSFKTSYDSTYESPWLLPNYQLIILSVINGVWLLSVLIFICYLMVMTCCREKNQLLWPSLMFGKLSKQTQKYMKHIVISRLLIEKMLSMPAMFAPIKEVSHYIFVINAYCHEAELIGDPLEGTLQRTLSELIEIHTRIAPKSLFAESTKDSISTTAAELMSMMPAFVCRLAQREYDFILVSPTKRRIILKLYCISQFLKHCKIGQDRKQLIMPATQNIWQETQDGHFDPGYFEDVYPPKEPVIPGAVCEKSDDIIIRLENSDSVLRHGLTTESSDDMLKESIIDCHDMDATIMDAAFISNLLIPGLNENEDSVSKGEQQAVSSFRTLNSSRGQSPVQSLSSTSLQSRPSTTDSTRRKGINISPPSQRPDSGSEGSQGFRPTSASIADSFYADESLPGAVEFEENPDDAKDST